MDAGRSRTSCVNSNQPEQVDRAQIIDGSLIDNMKHGCTIQETLMINHCSTGKPNGSLLLLISFDD